MYSTRQSSELCNIAPSIDADVRIRDAGLANAYGLHGIADVGGVVIDVDHADLVLAFRVHLVHVQVRLAPGGVEARRVSPLQPAASRELVGGSAVLGQVHAW